MINVNCDLWEYPADWRAITTNGSINSKGLAVMGRGCALEAKKRFPGLQGSLAYNLKLGGNHIFMFPEYKIITFPVKHQWFEKADINLITRSAEELRSNWEDPWIIAMPRPGCGNGGLSWADVRPVIVDILPDNVTILSL